MTRPGGRVQGMTAPYVPGQQLYLIVWGAYVKIGCSTDPIGRLGRVTERGNRPPRQNGDPELVGTVAGGFGAEAWLHAALAGHRAAGEWFHLRGPVRDLVEAAVARGVDDLAPRPSRTRRAAGARTQLRPGLLPYTAISGRDPEELSVRHAVLLSAEVAEADPMLGPGMLALCGTSVRRLLGAYTPRHVRACSRCTRGLPR